MDNVEQKSDESTIKKYLAIIALISRTENRLTWTELTYLSLNILFFLFTASLILFLFHKTRYIPSKIDLTLVYFSLFIGIALNAYWIASAMRTQLKLKIRYFQARFMERKLGSAGEDFFSDEEPFFDSHIHRLESPDNKETLLYPKKGITRMDGFIGAAAPRHFSWFMPIMFASVYWIIFIWVTFSIL